MNFDPSTDYYAALGVSEKAPADEIKKTYRRLAKKFHPDSTGGDKGKETRFKEVSTAYEVLGNQERREQYDRYRAGPKLPPGFEFGGQGTPGQGGGFGGAFDLGDLFSQVFSGSMPPAGAGSRDPRGQNGASWSFSSTDAAGAPGPGRVRRRRRQQAPSAPSRPREVTVHASDGSPLVKRRANIYSDIRVGIDQAVMGAVVQVPTLTGKAKVKIPPGTSSGAKLRLKGKGARTRSKTGNHESYGDHYVTVHIDVPKTIDDKAKKLLVQFMQRTKKS